MRKAQSFLLAASCSGLLVSCTLPTDDAPRITERLDTSSQVPKEIANVQQHPHRAMCSGHRWNCLARVRTDVTPLASPGNEGYGADDLQSAYGLTTAMMNSDPQATIGIIGAYGYSALASDLAAYRTQYGLPACTVASGCLTILNQNGATSPMPSGNTDWNGETALDVDMASAGCPKCKILVVMANNDQDDGLFIANTVAFQKGATVISNSWGGPEQGGESSYESYFNHPGVATFVATGDDGYDDGGEGPDYPSTSLYAIGVGGTTLTQSTTNTRGWTEAGWSDGGSSCSTSFARPSWQTATGSCTKRMTSDIAAVGDPNTGPYIYHAAEGGWVPVGGTSAASPLAAAIFAQTGHGDATSQFPYLHTAAFNDVTTGKNGTCSGVLCKAGAGWDGPTGVGTPNAAALLALTTTGGGGGGGTGTGSGSGGTTTGSGGGGNTGSGSATTGGGDGSDTGDGSDGGGGGGGGGGCGGGGGGGGSTGSDNGNGTGDNGDGSMSSGCAAGGNGGGMVIVGLGLALATSRRRRAAA
jgi:hypothetical protein